MGTVVATYTYDTTAEGWGFQASWYASDGSNFAGASAPGCMRIDALSSSSFWGQSGRGPTASWETLGVPAGATVQQVGLLYRSKLASFVTDGVATLEEDATLYTNTNSPIATFVASDITTQNTDWFTKGTAPGSISPTFGVSTQQVYLDIGFACNNRLHFLTQVDFRFDTVELTIDYVEPTPTIAARSAGELAGHAAIANAGEPVGGSGTLRARSAGVIAHALLTNFLGDAALEVYFAGAPDGTNETVLAYSLPTEFTLSNPQAGRNYILEKSATDLAGWASSRHGYIKFRRAGGAGGYDGDILLGGIEIIYTEKTV